MSVEKAIKYRRSMPEFDQAKKISDENLILILNAGRLAPSALGAEPTRVLVIRDPEIKAEIAKDGFQELNHKKVLTADSLVLFVSRKGKHLQDRDFLTKRLQKWNLSAQDLAFRVEAYYNYLNTVNLGTDVYSANQAYIAMAYMSLQAAELGIDSTIMQGFDFDKLNHILAEKGYIDSEVEAVYISLALGHVTGAIRDKLYPQVRIDLDEYSTII